MTLLTDPSTIQQISTHIEVYFYHSATEDILSTSLWSTHKAVLRCHLISKAAAKSKARLTDIKCLTKDLDNLYYKVTQSPSQDLTQQIQLKRQALDPILSANTEKSLRFSKAKFILQGNSTSAMFAKKLNQEYKPPHVYKLHD